MKKRSGFGGAIIGFAFLALISCVSSSSNDSTSKPSYEYEKSTYSPPSYQTPAKQTYTCSDGTEYESFTDYQNCENIYNWKSTRDKSLAECYADSSKINCWYDEYPGTTLHWEYYVYEAPKHQAPTSSGTRYGAICRDGTRSNATGRGACSHHGGVSTWLTR